MDKTNAYEVVEKRDYMRWVREHLEKNARKVSRNLLSNIFNEALALALANRSTFSRAEFNYVIGILESRSIPTPRLLVKNHKPLHNGEYPTRLVVPATNFTAGFANLGYRGIKAIFEKHYISFSKYNITQALHLKGELETLNIRCNFDSIISFDAVDMYPSITYAMVDRAVMYYSP